MGTRLLAESLPSPGRGLVVTRPGRVLHSLQYADDAWTLLRDVAEPTLQRFLEAVAVFARASNQHLNPAKSLILPVGETQWAAAAPREVGGRDPGGQPGNLSGHHVQQLPTPR
jgi:hypothetical protein